MAGTNSANVTTYPTTTVRGIIVQVGWVVTQGPLSKKTKKTGGPVMKGTGMQFPPREGFKAISCTGDTETSGSPV